MQYADGVISPAANIARAVVTLALLVSGSCLSQTQYASVTATVKCQSPTGGTPTILAGATVRLKNRVGGADAAAKTDASGKIKLAYSAYDLAPSLQVVYEGSVVTKLPGGADLTSTLKVLYDAYTPRPGALGILVVPPKVIAGVLELGEVQTSSIDCVIWRHAVEVLQTYHGQMNEVPPAGGYTLVRRAAGLPKIPWTSYDTVELSNDLNRASRCTIFHEFGHTVRHVLDGSHQHFTNDVFKYIYGQEHANNGITNVQHAFNEGVADYWQKIADGCGGQSAVGNNTDWREWDVADELTKLSAIYVNGQALGVKGVFGLLRENPGSIHSLYQFKAALNKKYPAQAPAPAAVAKCPTGYNNDGAFCRLDLTQTKPSYTRGAGYPLSACEAGMGRSGLLCYPTCPSGTKGSGPVCWETCRSGYHDDGLTCRKGLDIYGKDSKGRGVGVPMSCGPGRVKDGGLCYSACSTGFTGKGPVCWGACPAGTRDDGAICGSVHSIVIADF